MAVRAGRDRRNACGSRLLETTDRQAANGPVKVRRGSVSRSRLGISRCVRQALALSEAATPTVSAAGRKRRRRFVGGPAASGGLRALAAPALIKAILEIEAPVQAAILGAVSAGGHTSRGSTVRLG